MPERLRRVSSVCVALREVSGRVEAELADGGTLHADAAVLATGHEENPLKARSYAVRLGGEAEVPHPDAPVLILGTGLSMVDVWLSLAGRGHRGPIIALSRRGLLPAGHRRVDPVRFGPDDLPLGEGPGAFMRWLRDLAAGTETADGDWRSVIDGLRPFNQLIWQSWTERDKRRFLRHGKAAWQVHRHRMAPEIFRRIDAALDSGRLKVVAGRLGRVAGEDGAWRATLRRRGTAQDETVQAARIYDCSGVASDPAESSNPLIKDLLERGAATPDPMRIGLDVTTACALVGRDGTASERIYAVGPLTRGAFLEIEAVPDIRVQCAALARRLSS